MISSLVRYEHSDLVLGEEGKGPVGVYVVIPCSAEPQGLAGLKLLAIFVFICCANLNFTNVQH